MLGWNEGGVWSEWCLWWELYVNNRIIYFIDYCWLCMHGSLITNEVNSRCGMVMVLTDMAVDIAMVIHFR